MSFSRARLATFLLVFPAACSAAPTTEGESTGVAASAYSPEQVIPKTKYTLQLDSVEATNIVRPDWDRQAEHAWNEWAQLDVKVTSTSTDAYPFDPAVSACVLGDASSGTVFTQCSKNAPNMGISAGDTLMQTFVVADPGDDVMVAFALDNVGGMPAAAPQSWIPGILTIGGAGTSYVSSLMLIVESTNPVGTALGLLGAGISIMANGIPQQVTAPISCVGGLLRGVDPPKQLCFWKSNQYDKIGTVSVEDTCPPTRVPAVTWGHSLAQIYRGTDDTAYLHFSPADLEKLTADGPAHFEIDSSVGPGAPLSTNPESYCASSHKAKFTLSREWRSGLAPSPKSGEFALARGKGQIESFWGDDLADQYRTVDRRFYDERAGGWQTTHAATSSATTAATPIAAVARASGYLDAFWVDENGALWSSWANPASTTPSLSQLTANGTAPPHARITAAARTPFDIDVFYVDKNGVVVRYFWSEGIGWKSSAISGANAAPPGAPIAAVARTWANLDLFFVDDNGTLQTMYWSLGNSNFGIRIASGASRFDPGAQITAVARDTKTIDAFLIAKDGAVYQANWTDTTDLSTGPVTAAETAPRGGSISAVSSDYRTLEVAFVASNHLKLMRSSTGGKPYAIEDAGTPTTLPNSPLSLVATTNTDLTIFFRDIFNRPAMSQYVKLSQTWATSLVPFATTHASGLSTLGGVPSKCLASTGAVAGSTLLSTACDDSPQQRFMFNAASQGSADRQRGGQVVSSANLNLCLDYRNAPQVTFETCGSSYAQSFAFKNGVLSATSGNANQCLDIYYANANGGALDLTTCNGTAAQLFVPFGLRMQIQSTQPGPQCVIPDEDRPGSSIVTWRCNDGGAHAFTYTEKGQLTVSGLCLTVADLGAGTTQLQACTGNGNQNWYYDGTTWRSIPVQMFLQPTPSIMGCLDVYYDRPGLETPIDYTTCNGTEAQQWSLSSFNTPGWPFGNAFTP